MSPCKRSDDSRYNNRKLNNSQSVGWLVLPVFMALMSLLSAPALAQHSSVGRPIVRMTFSDQAVTNQNAFPIRLTSAAGPVGLQESDFALRLRGTTPADNGDIRLERPEVYDSAQVKEVQDQTRAADAPVEPPTFELQPPATDNRTIVQNPQSDSSTAESYLVPRVADVQGPLPLTPLANLRQNDPGGLLARDADVSPNQFYADRYSDYAQLNGMASQTKFKTWQAPNFYHQPLYFEDRNLERNGNELAYQNVASAARFLTTIPTLPYRMGHQLPLDRVYTHGLVRPGDPACYERERMSPNPRGAALQTIVTLGIILP